MKDRIKQYIDQKGITAGELAVLLDVQRSNISHILNGRNKPGAAFIEKLLLVFSDINARWLLTGHGTMLNSEQEQPKNKSVNTIATTLFEQEEEMKPKQNEEKVVQESVPQIAAKDDVEKMILLYADGTFDTYKSRDKKG